MDRVDVTLVLGMLCLIAGTLLVGFSRPMRAGHRAAAGGGMGDLHEHDQRICIPIERQAPGADAPGALNTGLLQRTVHHMVDQV